jgi:ABC-type nickel/cobalt efflux system permease component RcnA
LSAYPADLLTNPRNDRQARFTILPASGSLPLSNAFIPKTVGGPLGIFDRTRDDFANLLTTRQELSPLVLLISLFAAMALGALHAFSPGHGKAVVGAYLVGSRGNWQHAVFLGLVVTATHTAGVYALGFVTLFLSAYILPEQLFPWLGFLSGLLVAIIGARLLIERFRTARAGRSLFPDVAAQSHTNGNGTEHAHPHHKADWHTDQRDAMHFPNYASNLESAAPLALLHSHADGTMHSHVQIPANGHAPSEDDMHTHPDGTIHSHNPYPGGEHRHPDVHSHAFATPEEEAAHAREHLAEIERLEKPSWRNLLSLGISGGLLPCPSALVVMLSAIALGRVLYGLYLIVGFSLGLAGVLVVTGLSLLYAGKVAGRFFRGRRVGWFMRYLPVVGAFVVTLLGVAIALDAFFQTGWVP